jgi:hypothetical protein
MMFKELKADVDTSLPEAPRPTPSSNTIALDAGEVAYLRKLQKNVRNNVIALAGRAYQIRLQHLREDGKRYDKDFEKWWRDYELNRVFGKRSNFTKYAAAGEALEKAKINEYNDRMPITLNALYEVAQLGPDEIKLCLENRYVRSSVTATPTCPKQPDPVIHAEATDKEIRNWRKRWRHPDQYGPSSSDNLTSEELDEIASAVTKALKPYKGYELAKEIENLIRLHRKRLKRAEAKAAKKRSRAGVDRQHKVRVFLAELLEGAGRT